MINYTVRLLSPKGVTFSSRNVNTLGSDSSSLDIAMGRVRPLPSPLPPSDNTQPSAKTRLDPLRALKL